MIMMKTATFLMAIILTVSNSTGFETSPPTRRARRTTDGLRSSSSFAKNRPIVPSKSLAHITTGGGALKQQSDSSSTTTTSSSRPPVDFAALTKYTVSLAVQMGLIFGLFTGIDKAVSQYDVLKKIPLWANAIFFYAFNLKTSLFSPLPNKGDSSTKEWEYQKRNRPSWTPPGWVFAVMWPLFVFGTRAVTAAAVVQKTGVYANSAIMALMFHLCIGSLWNTVNNVDRRLGFSVPVLYGLALTKAFAAYHFYLVDPFLGKCLSATLTWLGAAAALETHTWRINPDPDTNKPEPLYPAKGKWKTRFRWEASS